MNYRFKHDLNVIKFPEGFTEENRGLKNVCCIPELKLGSTSSTDSYKNDVIGTAVKISDPSDSVVFTIEKSGTAGLLPLLGDTLTAPQDPLLVGHIFDCRQYLAAYGAGCYTVKVVFTISGIVGGYTWGTYRFKEFTIKNARGTVRIWSEFDSFYQTLLMDFTGSNYRDSVRFNGFFGNRKPNPEINQLIDQGREVVKAKFQNVNSYILETDPVEIKITKQLLDWHFINQDICLMSDHNKSNHDYNLFDIPVAIKEVDDPVYIKRSRLATISATFGDRKLTDQSYYNLQ